MGELKIKEITSFEENSERKTRLIISDKARDGEIIFKGEGKLKATVEA